MMQLAPYVIFAFPERNRAYQPILPAPPRRTLRAGLPKWRVVTTSSGSRTPATIPPQTQPRKATLMTDSGPQEVNLILRVPVPFE